MYDVQTLNFKKQKSKGKEPRECYQLQVTVPTLNLFKFLFPNQKKATTLG